MSASAAHSSVFLDFIVGCCGETDEEFQDTVDLVRYGRFKNSFIFKYSERPGTKSAELFADDVPEEIKKRRNNELLKIQDEISLAQNQVFVGKPVRILVENTVKRQENGMFQYSGRTSDDRIVVFDAPETELPSSSLIGTFQTLKIEAAAPFTLFGTPLTNLDSTKGQ